MKFKSYHIELDGIGGICKSPSAWGYSKDENAIYPLIYFRKPKWISEEKFKELITFIELKMPVDFEL